MIGTFMAVLDATIVNVGLPKIMASFGVGIDKIEWVLTAYMLALAVMLPTAGWLADRFGYKRLYFIGIMLFTFGSFLCGISNDENVLIISRVVQGLGAGIIMPLGMAIVSREFPPHQRGMALGFWGIAAAASVSFGPLIGGYLVDNFSWQLIFYVNLPVGILGMIATVVIQKEYVNKKVRTFDLVGFISVSLFLPLILYALAEGSASTNSEGWSAPYVMVCIAISLIAFVVFITNELMVKEPLIDLRLFRSHNFAVSNITMFIFGIGMFGSTFLLPLYLQNSLGYTAIQAGAVFLPVGIIQGAISPVIGRIADKTNPKVPIVLGVILLAFSFLLNSKMSFLTEHFGVMVTLYLRGFAMGIMFTPLNTVSLLEVPREKMAQASGIINIVRQLGGSFGVAILATLLITRVSYHTEMYAESVNPRSEEFQAVSAKMQQQIIHNAGSAPSMAARQSQSMIVGQLNKESYIQGIDDDFLAACVFTLIGGIPVLFLHIKKKTPPSKIVHHE
ncbi:MAG: DHA2 family efflux MFS transporter permease subunit [Bacteroidota bacterium]|nr:DHA2 family efflux MFS transporter permease subunit [Bacteroidota bacterium]